MRQRIKGDWSPYEIIWTRKDGGRVKSVLHPYDIGRKGISLGLVTDITQIDAMGKSASEIEHEYRTHLDFQKEILLVLKQLNSLESISPSLIQAVLGSICTFEGKADEAFVFQLTDEKLAKYKLGFVYPEDEDGENGHTASMSMPPEVFELFKSKLNYSPVMVLSKKADSLEFNAIVTSFKMLQNASSLKVIKLESSNNLMGLLILTMRKGEFSTSSDRTTLTEIMAIELANALRKLP